jgi:hypothetical protein
MIKTGSPKSLWDHCIKLEALLCSLTCNDIYMINGEVPETIMTGSMADISHISEFGWYDWVVFWDNVPTFPDDKLTLRQYLGPMTDVGLALTAKILKANGQFVCHLTLRHLNADEPNCVNHAEMCKAFDASIYEAIGPAATENDFPAKDLTPDYEAYDETIMTFDPDYGYIEVTPETGDTFIGAEILLPHGGTITKDV